MPLEKYCPDCRMVKPASDFSPQHCNRTDGLRPYCRPCTNIRNARSFERHKEKRLAHYRAQNKTEHHRKYNREYQNNRNREMRDAAASRPRPEHCEICGGECRVVFDHDHKTGKFRGWLCKDCNLFLGLLEKSPSNLPKKLGPTRVRQLANYLEANCA